MTVTITHAKVSSGTVNDNVEVDLADWNDDHVITNLTAADVTFTATGGISSNTVQTAIAEIDSETVKTADLAAVALSGSGSDIASGNMGLTTLTITGGSLASGTGKALSITGTMSATAAAQTAVLYTITSAGSDANGHVGFQTQLAAGYTGAGNSSAIVALNQAAGTAATVIPAAGSNAQALNLGTSGQAAGATAGSNVGLVGKATGSTTSNIGVLGLSQIVANGAKNIGGAFSAINTGTTPVQVGIWASLNQTTLPTSSAALIADNGAQTDAIARFQDNGTDVLSINDGGTVTMSTALTASVQAGIAYPFIVGGSVAVDFNAANTDHSITITSPTINYRIQAIIVINSGTTASLTTARGGMFTTTGGGGTAVVADQVLTAITSNAANTSASLTNIAAAGNAYWNRTGANSFYWRTSTAQGAAATGKVYVMIQPLP